MSFFNGRKKPNYFVSKNFKTKLLEKCNLILSPEFYWSKKVTLNLRYSYEANKMAQSVFDGVLPDGNFKYKVFKMAKKEFIFIAYDVSNILKELEDMGMDIKMVDKIYTLQSEFLNRDIALKIDDKHAIVANDGIMTSVPLKLLNSGVEVYISDVLKDKKLSSNYIYSKNFKKTNLGSRQSNQIISILSVLALILIFNLFRLQEGRNLLLEQKKNLIEKYNLPQTSFQVKSMQDELSEIDKHQSDLREMIKYVGKFKLSKDEFLSSLSYKKSLLKFVIRLKNSRREKEFKTYMSKKYKILKAAKSNKGYMIEVGL
ncbi:MAG: hypothetical protein QM482_09185 [Sulfurospirillum sp.]